MVLGKPHQVRFREDSPRLFPELEGFVPKPRPNGKISMEVPTSEFPHIRTASRCSVGSLVFLDRRSDAAPGLEPVPVAEAADLILRDMATYGDEVFARHERGVRRLVEAPAYRLRYHALDDAIRLLHVLNDTSPRP